MIKKTLDEWLDNVDYSYLNSDKYQPSEFALTFMNFIKLVNGAQGEANKTPPMHLAMLDKLSSSKGYIANLCFRGAAKTTLYGEYLVLYIAVFGNIPNMRSIEGIIYVADSMENGAKNLRKNIEFRYFNSDFLQEWIPKATFTDNYLEFTNREGKLLEMSRFFLIYTFVQILVYQAPAYRDW